jgi:surfeit locus 1 family protein
MANAEARASSPLAGEGRGEGQTPDLKGLGRALLPVSPHQGDRRNALRLLGPGLMTLAMLAVLIGLGVWQVRRLAWKEGVLARIAAAEQAPAIDLPVRPSEFAKVRVSGRLRTDLSAYFGAEVRDTAGGPRMGAELIQPLERNGAAPILVDRGWVPLPGWLPRVPSVAVTIVEGFVREPERPGWFTPSPEVATKHFYALDPPAIGAALGLKRVAPFVLIALGPERAALPEPARHLPRPPNNHLSYVVTWFGLALALLAVFAAWARTTLLGPRRP